MTVYRSDISEAANPADTLTQPSSLQNCEKMHFCFIRLTVGGTLLLQPWLTDKILEKKKSWGEGKPLIFKNRISMCVTIRQWKNRVSPYERVLPVDLPVAANSVLLIVGPLDYFDCGTLNIN